MRHPKSVAKLLTSLAQQQVHAAFNPRMMCARVDALFLRETVVQTPVETNTGWINGGIAVTLSPLESRLDESRAIRTDTDRLCCVGLRPAPSGSKIVRANGLSVLSRKVVARVVAHLYRTEVSGAGRD